MRSEILEVPKDVLKSAMELAVCDLRQERNGKWCDLDVLNVLDRLHELNYITSGVTTVWAVSFQGPVRYYSQHHGQVVWADRHTVAQVGYDGIVIDAASRPWNRVYFSLEDYKLHSGIFLPSDYKISFLPVLI